MHGGKRLVADEDEPDADDTRAKDGRREAGRRVSQLPQAAYAQLGADHG